MKNFIPNLWIVLVLLPSLKAVDYDDDFNWKLDMESHGNGKTPACMDIPKDLRLCYDVGYNKMMLPNLLDHESIMDVKMQAIGWVPLVHKACHPSTQLLLCSLFAPVCLERPLYPCRWLCEAVRDKCAPLMESFGFAWPEMLNCDKFPQDDLCISMNETSSNISKPAGQPSVCPPCDNEMNADAILEHMCASEFAIKAKIKEVKIENLDRKVILQKRRKPLRPVTLKKEELKKLVLYLKNGANCNCQQLDNHGKFYLIMGRLVGKQHILTGIHKWDKSSQEFKKVLKKLKSHKCPEFEGVFK